MKTIKATVRSLVLANIILLFGACEKQLEVEKSVNLILMKDAFANTQTANSALIGLYSRLVATSMHLSNGGLSLYPALSADELRNTNTNANYDVFLSNIIPSTNTVINTNFWSSAYRNIYHANALIEGLEHSQSIPKAHKEQLIGEAICIRAFYYFYLVNLFGEVPLILSTDYEDNLKALRVPISQVYKQLSIDLEQAVSLVADNYPSANKGRINKMVVKAFLARVNLYLGNWEKADEYATQVIESKQYSLEADIDKVFLSNSTETIWQLIREANNTAEAVLFIPASATVIPTFDLTDGLWNSFENSDYRKSKWVATRQVSGRTYRYPFKYKQRTNAIINENLVVFRLAEQYLIRAEAKMNTGQIDLGIADLNALRLRCFPVGSNYHLQSTADQQGALSLVKEERSKELFCEWGHRWFDLKRLNIVGQELSPSKPNWKAYMQLYPIPSAELLINIYLTQNVGYER